ncbi:uncharacterized protein UTRI_00916 [Ustilago trichophora]|uniref:Uncharacterized protein n=1 Tax=Ustilago trichophora TaxID=86804 RepID=A0A5C3DWK6_9BASI|nr:uncharacterized protein UTRI_00916 [Ustilago trichophora]
MKLFRRGRGSPTDLEVVTECSPVIESSNAHYPENLVNLISFYVCYLVVLASAVLIFFFGWRERAVTVQTFDVQAYPAVVYGWNADAAATTSPSISPTAAGAGGVATCTPDFYEKGSYLQYACTSIAAEGTEKLRFYLTTLIPFPPTSSFYIPRTQRYKDIAVSSYYVHYSTYLPSKSTSTGASSSTPSAAGSAQSSTSSAGLLSPTPAQAASSTSATSTSAAAVLQPRQASATSAPFASAIPTSSLSLVSIQYPTSSLSALMAGTIVSRFPTPSATTTSIPVESAAFSEGYTIFFTVIAALPLFSMTMTLILATYNLNVARKKDWPPEPGHGQGEGENKLRERLIRLEQLATSPAAPSPATVPLSIYNDHMNLAKLWADKGPLSPWTGRGGSEVRSPPTRRPRAETQASPNVDQSVFLPPAYEQAREHSSSSATGPVVASSTAEPIESHPPAYQEEPTTGASVTMPPNDLANEGDDDAIEVASSVSTDSEDGSDSHRAAPRIVPIRSGFGISCSIPADKMVPPKTRTDGTRLPVRLAWMILPTYAFVFHLDLVIFVLVVIPELVALAMAADAFKDVTAFLRTGGCIGASSAKGSVYDLQRSLCGPQRFLASYPQEYSNARPATTMSLFARDPAIVLSGLVILFVAHVAWIATLIRKSHLAEKKGMEPYDSDSGRMTTGTTRWGYVTVWNKVGVHGWFYHDAAEIRANQRPGAGDEHRLEDFTTSSRPTAASGRRRNH